MGRSSGGGSILRKTQTARGKPESATITGTETRTAANIARISEAEFKAERKRH